MPTNIDTSEIPDFEVHDGYTKKFFSQNQTGNCSNNRRIRYLRHSFLWVRRYSKRSGNDVAPVKKPVKKAFRFILCVRQHCRFEKSGAIKGAVPHPTGCGTAFILPARERKETESRRRPDGADHSLSDASDAPAGTAPCCGGRRVRRHSGAGPRRC